MKQKIIVTTGLIAVLILSVFLVLTGCEESVTSFYYEDGELYTADSEGNTYDAVDIERIEVEWISGDISVKAVEGGEIKFYEDAKNGLSDTFRLHYYLDGTTLSIKFMASEKNVKINSIKKKLHVELPISYQLPSFKISSVSGDISMDGISAKATELESVNGYIDVDGLKGDSLSVESVSGKITLNTVGLSYLNIESVSGTMNVTQADVIYDVLRIESVSGRVNLFLAENDGFTLTRTSVSGDLSCIFEVDQINRRYTYKDGGADLRITTVSGNVFIKKA